MSFSYLSAMINYDLIIVGAGASGLLAAGFAAESGLKVLLLDKMSQTGRKLSITGKGRCNLTNETELQDFIDQVNPDGRFLQSTFSRFYNHELIELLNRIGIQTKLERGGRYFPANDSAPDVTRKLKEWCERNNVAFIMNFRVNRIITRKTFKNGSEVLNVKGVQGTIPGESKSLIADRVLICTGGLSYPATGSDGDGHRMVKQIGHSVSHCLPSLVPLEIDRKLIRQLTGLELRNVRADVKERGKVLASEFGELSFINTGLSGPIILTLSRIVVPLLHQQRSICIVIDFKPALDSEKLDKRLIRDFTDRGKEPISSILRGLMPKKLVPVCLEQTRIPSDLMGALVSAKQRKKLLEFLKGFSIKLNGYRPFSEAIVTIGGVSVDEIHQKTMESKLVSGLYMAGELLDLDGPTGGFNLQIAFSTAWAAADTVIKEVKNHP
ncbi:MAG: NAD(P)/FAD-dependent oxidoreductase [Bacteroidota bacterium]|nr:NAD(P)/FAD-dependent oxidoreductase [Bacteroidota bacterium]